MQHAGELDHETVYLGSMRDCLEALRSDKLKPVVYAAQAPFREGTIIKLHGAEHVARRRVLNKLVRREAHTYWRESVLVPVLLTELTRVLREPDPDGLVRLDLIPFATHFFNVMATALSGIDVTTTEDRELLLSLIEPLNAGDAVQWEEQPGARFADGIAALTTFREQFFEPSLSTRRTRIRQLEAGEVRAEDVPVDMMLLVAMEADPAWADKENALRNVMQFMLGASHTNVHPLGFAIDHLETWFDSHPEDYDRRTDPAFLESAVNEALRLHTIGPILERVAIENLTLASGIAIKADQRVAVGIQEASTDPTVYGEDAQQFNPNRTIAAAGYPYGLAFGSGAHMCQGLPIVVGVEGIDGALVHVLRALYEAGARRDRSRPTRRQELGGFRSSYLSYPLILDPHRATAEHPTAGMVVGTGQP